MQPKLTRAKTLLASVNHAAMATVNVDGSPHNTPFFFMRSPDLRYVYWGSHPDSQHSQNVIRTGQVFIVLYDAIERGGLYVRATNARIASGDELVGALHEHNIRRIRQGKSPLLLNYYESESPQRMWVADTQEFWINDAERANDGTVIKDLRLSVKRTELLDEASIEQ